MNSKYRIRFQLLPFVPTNSALQGSTVVRKTNWPTLEMVNGQLVNEAYDVTRMTRYKKNALNLWFSNCFNPPLTLLLSLPVFIFTQIMYHAINFYASDLRPTLDSTNFVQQRNFYLSKSTPNCMWSYANFFPCVKFGAWVLGQRPLRLSETR